VIIIYECGNAQCEHFGHPWQYTSIALSDGIQGEKKPACPACHEPLKVAVTKSVSGQRPGGRPGGGRPGGRGSGRS